MMTIRAPRNIPPRWIFLTVAMTSGGGGPGGVPGGGGVDVSLDQMMQGIALDRQGVGDRDQVQDDPGSQPQLLLRLDPERR